MRRSVGLGNRWLNAEWLYTMTNARFPTSAVLVCKTDKQKMAYWICDSLFKLHAELSLGMNMTSLNMSFIAASKNIRLSPINLRTSIPRGMKERMWSHISVGRLIEKDTDVGISYRMSVSSLPSTRTLYKLKFRTCNAVHVWDTLTTSDDADSLIYIYIYRFPIKSAVLGRPVWESSGPGTR